MFKLRQYRRDSAIRRMKKKRLRQSLLKAFLGMMGTALISLFFVFCHDYVLQSSYFEIKSLEITGNRKLTKEQVLDTAKIAIDANVLSVNVGLARKFLLSNLWIAEADVFRDLPSRVVIKLREHDPLAVVDLAGRKFILNSEGKIFKEASEGDAAGLPLIEGLVVTDLDLGGLKRSRGYESALSILEIGRDHAFLLPNQNIERITVDKEEGITLYAKGQIRAFQVNSVKMGFNDYPEKFERLKKIVDHFRNIGLFQGIDWIDINHMNRVVLNPLVSDPLSSGHKEI